jgi:hypothetical protein
MHLPRARQDGLTVHDLPDETLVYDVQHQKAHRLNRTSSLIWRHCDGQTSVEKMVLILREQLGTTSDEAIVSLALEQFSKRNLLEVEVPVVEGEKRYQRREVLRTLVAAMVAAPLVMTMRPPKAMAQISQMPPGNVCVPISCFSDSICQSIAPNCFCLPIPNSEFRSCGISTAS